MEYYTRQLNGDNQMVELCMCVHNKLKDKIEEHLYYNDKLFHSNTCSSMMKIVEIVKKIKSKNSLLNIKDLDIVNRVNKHFRQEAEEWENEPELQAAEQDYLFDSTMAHVQEQLALRGIYCQKQIIKEANELTTSKMPLFDKYIKFMKKW